EGVPRRRDHRRVEVGVVGELLGRGELARVGWDGRMQPLDGVVGTALRGEARRRDLQRLARLDQLLQGNVVCRRQQVERRVQELRYVVDARQRHVGAAAGTL